MNLKLMKFSIFTLGLISLFYGWTQGASFSAMSYEYTDVLILRTVRHYVFLTSGGILLILSIIIELIEDKFRQLIKNNNKSSLQEEF